MGYDLHISRAPAWIQSRRYPILGEELIDLVRREPDLAFEMPGEPNPEHFLLTVGTDDWLHFWNGQLQTKHPGEALTRRMIELATTLDAWVYGDDGEIYQWDGTAVKARQPELAEMPFPSYHLTRHTVPGGFNAQAPIPEREWLDLVASLPDFTVMTRVRARLPSGLRWIACPPVACWTAHPSGEPVPFFHDRDLIEVSKPDEATLSRLCELAPPLGAAVLDGRENPVGQ
ncbi:MAG TPA: hypothetical protein VH561_16360 [Micromonosporaceae bacterium]